MRMFLKRVISGAAAVLLASLLLFPALASEDRNRMVKVGFFAYPGYHEYDGKVRSGYSVDFLTLLQRYTHLRYDYARHERLRSHP